MTEQDEQFEWFLPTLLSLTIFTAVYRWAGPFVSNAVCDSYNNFDKATKIDWDTRVTSTVHAIVVSTLAIYILATEQTFSEHLIDGKSDWSKYTLALSCGYLLQDGVVLIYNRAVFTDASYSMIIHHVISLNAFYLSMSGGYLLYYSMFRLLAELSTPFVNYRRFLAVSGCPATSMLYIGNGLMMASVFSISRIIPMPYYYYKVLITIPTDSFKFILPTHFKIFWFSTCIVLDIMNFYWLYKMINMGMRIIRVKLDQNKNVENVKMQ